MASALDPTVALQLLIKHPNAIIRLYLESAHLIACYQSPWSESLITINFMADEFE
jgi:hypothetical protein